MTIWFPGEWKSLKELLGQVDYSLASQGLLSKRGFAVAWISFSFPEFQFYFLTMQKAPKGKRVGFLQIIPGNPVNLQSQLLKFYWVEMSKQGQFPRVSVDTCFLASYYSKSIGKVLGLRWPGMHLSVDRRKDWSSKWADVRSHPLFWWAVRILLWKPDVFVLRKADELQSLS